jgi:hypothetical protein
MEMGWVGEQRMDKLDLRLTGRRPAPRACRGGRVKSQQSNAPFAPADEKVGSETRWRSGGSRIGSRAACDKAELPADLHLHLRGCIRPCASASAAPSSRFGAYPPLLAFYDHDRDGSIQRLAVTVAAPGLVAEGVPAVGTMSAV